jgi:prepilin-type N-terminal cleavage/methylation domain-containing protein
MCIATPINVPNARRGFTLVELMVVLVIIGLLASLTLAGLAGVRQRGKLDKTKSTIRKIHEIIVPRYESYLRRRVPITGATPAERATSRLVRQRFLIAAELPDQWLDVAPAVTPPFETGPMLAYAAYKAGLIANAANTTWNTNANRYEGAECLAMIVMFGGVDSDAMEQFRADELGDIDGDGAVEFWDGWGRPIGFIRWPAGFVSPLQSRNATENPDPFDPLRVTPMDEYPPGVTQRDYATVPLIYSAGPDEAFNDPLGNASGYGLQTEGPTDGWVAALLNISPLLTTRVGKPPSAPAESTVQGAVTDPVAAADNITNHDFMKK